MTTLFTVNQICAALETPSCNEAVLDNVHNFQFNPGSAIKKDLTVLSGYELTAARKFNLAVTAFLILAK